MAGLFEPQVFSQFYLKTYFEMCEDQVASVREVAARQCYLIAKSLARDADQIKALMEKVTAFK